MAGLLEPTEGELLVDGTHINQYIAADLRQATAIFSQGHQLFPLSLFENIGLGFPELAHDASLVMKAAQQGGAATLISKFKDGFETVLSSVSPPYVRGVEGDPDHPLQKELERLEMSVEISGGETQRVIA